MIHLNIQNLIKHKYTQNIHDTLDTLFTGVVYSFSFFFILLHSPVFFLHSSFIHLIDPFDLILSTMNQLHVDYF